MPKPEKPLPIVKTDLRDITRNSKKCVTYVTLHWDWDTRIEWLIFGEVQLRYQENLKQWTLAARLIAGVTDFEHDSAYALQLPLIGLQFENFVEYSRVHADAWIEPNDPERFRVPLPGYNPMKHPKTVICDGKKHCKWGDSKSHPIIPEGFYAGPPTDLELYKLVRGKRISIIFGPTPEKEEDE